MCGGWRLGFKGLGLSFNAPYLPSVILGKQSNFFEHPFPPTFDDDELTDVSARRDGE